MARVGAAALTAVAAGLVLAGCGSSEPKPPPDTTPPPPPGRMLVVDPSGSDAGPGSRARPFRTIQHAVDVARAGDEVLVEPGAYHEDVTMRRSGTPGAPVQLLAAGTTRPLLTGRIKITASNVLVSGLEIVGGSAANPNDVAVYVSGGSGVDLVGNEIRDAAMSGVFVEHARGARIVRNWIHDNGTTVLDHGIYWASGDGGVIASNLVDRNVGYGIQLYPNADRVLVTQNTVVRNGRSGIIVGGETSTADGNRIVNNIVALNREEGIRTFWGGATGVGNVAEQNLIWDNGDSEGTSTEGLDLRATIEADPLFVNAARGNFAVRAGSPALDVALPDASQADDLGGTPRPQGEGGDLGAFERRVGDTP